MRKKQAPKETECAQCKELADTITLLQMRIDFFKDNGCDMFEDEEEE